MRILLLLAGLCGCLAKTIRLLDYVVAVVCHLGLGAFAFGWQLAILLRTHPLGRAVASFALGMLSLLVAVTISGIKAGWWRHVWQRLRRSWLD